jgi:transcription termination/antitermination protein NusG
MDDENKVKENNDQEVKERDINIISISDLPSDGAKWYVVHTYSGHENKVAVTLKQRASSLGFLDRVFKVLIPTQKKIMISEGKRREVDEHILPGYVVILMKLSDEVWHLVRSTRGVTGFVGVGSTPTPLPESEIRTLMKFMRMDAPKFEARYSVGDGVKIIDGPWKDYTGQVDEVNEEQGRVTVLVSIFTRETPMELEFGQVTPL